MRWIMLFAIIGGLFLVGFSLWKIRAKQTPLPASSVVVDSSAVPPSDFSPPPPPPLSPYVACESFFAKEEKILGAYGEGYTFEGPPDYVEGKTLFYHRSRGTRL